MHSLSEILNKPLLIARLGRPYYVVPVVACGLSGLMVAGPEDIVLSIEPLVFLVTGLLALGMAMWTENEIADRDNDTDGERKSRWGLYVAGGTGLISPSGPLTVDTARRTTIVLIGVGLGCLALASLDALFLGAIFVVSGLSYSIAPFRLKNRGVIGALIIALTSGTLAFTIGWSISGTPFQFDWLYATIALSALYLASDSIAHCIDYDDDSRAGDRTVAVQLGVSKTLDVARILITGSLLFFTSLVLSREGAVSYLPLIILVAFVVLAASIMWLIRDFDNMPNRGIARLLSIPMICSAALLLVSL